jgi:DNA-binding NtrC family response regulator
MKMPLEDVKLLDLSHAMAGPFCSTMLGDFGAQVVKVEPPRTGDIARAWGPPFSGTETTYFVSLHRNKKSIEIDFKHTAGRELFFRLMEKADVVLENYRVGTLETLGIAYEEARKRHPGIIYCSVSGFGQDGPYRDRAALDLIVQAESGMISVTGEAGGRGVRCGVSVADMVAGMYAAFGIHVVHQIAMALENAHSHGWPGGSREALETAYAEIERLKDQLQRENIALREEIDTTSMFEEIVGASAPLRTVLSHVAKVAPTDSTVLITGETGTGKELVARAIHKRSPRSGHAFVSVNCAAIPSSLVASELFGHEKGAFTGAVQRRKGRFELADGGTIFLDEVGELPAETQMTLLRVLQERQFERVGGSEAIRADVRVIAATNRDLEVAIADGTFRADLFYRLNVFPLEVPPLRERRADIPLLVEYFIHRYAQRAGKRIRSVSRESSSLLQAYDWPGNIRELQNVVERAVILSDSDVLSIDQRWLSGRSVIPRAVAGVTPTLATHERDAIEKALTETKGRVAGPFGAAGRLGVPPSTLESKIKALQIDKHRFKSA